MRIAAYVLAADPAWLLESVLSYYDRVDTIVVSYDEHHRSWTGTVLPVDECLGLLRGIDRDAKMVLAPGHFARLEHHPLENDTYQRQCALDAASAYGDWVLQVDTDEVLADWGTFRTMLGEADAQGFGALDFPARSLFQRFGERRYLELARRGWRIAAGYPGPVAVRSNTTLTHCRQADNNRTYRVDFARRNTDPARARDAIVHRRIGRDRGIWHYSWIRDPELMRRKSKWSGHADQRDWERELRQWSWAERHPYLATLASPSRELTLRPGVMWLRPATVDLPGPTRPLGRGSAPGSAIPPDL